MKKTISTKMANFIENGLGVAEWTLQNNEQITKLANIVIGGDNNEIIKNMSQDYISMSAENTALTIKGISSFDLLNRYNMLLHQFTIYVSLLNIYDERNGTNVLNSLIEMQRSNIPRSIKPVIKGGKKKTSENYDDIIIKCLNKCIKKKIKK